ncbi:MAG: MBL fold metallo-hydrolase [Pseudomonadales bacterium]|jgi:glyoxylase-like metal-dependent hydrolase (beta-lactamase superfamily II)|nr:MBL fold metallo-hydrolase [Pseudomonadales bacterium]
MIETLSHGITCIDTGYHRAGLAACYLVVDEGEAALIETGTALNLPAILQALAECDVAPQQLRYIIPTHVHLDHAGGAGALLARCPQATLVAHPRGARHLIDPERLIAGAKAVYGDESFTRMYGDIVPAPAERVREAADGSRWTLGRRELLVRDTPGHARHHFCLWDETSRGWFTGDTFGIGYRELYCRGEPYLIPTTTPVQFEPGALLASIELLMAAEPRYCYLTHFGRIAASARHAESLRRQIRDYVRFAEGVDIGADGAQSALTEALMTYTVDGLRAAGSTLPVTTLRALLALDMDLSAQGLVHWMRHR